MRPIGAGGTLFKVQGKISANLSFSVSAGVEVLGKVIAEKTVFSIPLASKTLFNTASSISTANPINSLPPANYSIDVIFDASLYSDGPNGDFLNVQVDDGNANFIYNNVLVASYALTSVHSITIFGSDANSQFSISGNFGGSIPIQIDGGNGGNNQLFFDDQSYSGPSTTYYEVHDSHIERDSMLKFLGLPILEPTTEINFQNVQFVSVNGARNSNDDFYIFNLVAQTAVVGGNESNQYSLGGPTQSIDRLFDYLEITGGQGYDQIVVSDEGNTNRTQYVVGHDRLDWTRVVTFTSPSLKNGVEQYLRSDYFLDYSNIDDVVVDAGSGGNAFTVDDVPGANDVDPNAMTIVLDTGTGSDTVAAQATTGPLLIHGQGGSDVVNVGVPASGTEYISGRVSVDNSASAFKRAGTTLNIDDAGDSTARTVTFSTNQDGQGLIDGFVGTHTYPNPFAPSQSTTTIAYQSSDVVAVNVQGSNGVNTFNVVDTPRSPLIGGLFANHVSTNLTLGDSLSSVVVSGTTGQLDITGGGSNSNVYLGGTGSAGNLSKLTGPIYVSGTLNALTIDNEGNNSFGYYTLAADGFSGGSNGAIHFLNLSPFDLDIDLGDGGNQVVVNGTPTIPAYQGAGVALSTGNGNDSVQVDASSALVDIQLGAGSYQTVSIGSIKASLSGIEEVDAYGSGTVQSFISDAAATTSQTFNVSSLFGEDDTERVTRTQLLGDSTTTLNDFTFNFQSKNLVYLYAGQGGDLFDIQGTPANTTTTVYGGPRTDSVAVESDDLTLPVLGPIYFYGNAAQGDNAEFFSGDANTPAQSYILQATPSRPSQPTVMDQQLVLLGTDAPIKFQGIASLSLELPAVGGNLASIQGVPSGESLYVNALQNDRIVFGNAISSPIGDMNEIFGNVSIIANDQDLSVTLDDTIDSIGRHVVLHPPTNEGAGYITGMSPGTLRLAIGYGSSVRLLGGLGNDTFSLANADFPYFVGIDGGEGTNTLDYSSVLMQGGGGNDTFAPTGVYVNLQNGQASGLSGEISRIQDVIGSAFDDILIGAGECVLNGGAGRDLLIAGPSLSTLLGGSGEDILVGGTVGYANYNQLTSVLAAWTANLDYSQLEGLVTSNGGKNTLLGQGDGDVFFVGKGDTNQTDEQKGETVVTF